jgi:hypothetical protein
MIAANRPAAKAPEWLSSPYGAEIAQCLPRLLGQIDTNAASRTRGVADRQFWAWKLIDFPNATPQGAVNGLAHLLSGGEQWHGIADQALLARISDLVAGVGKVMRRDGSLEEALPYERSFCVTALVGFDLLRARDDLMAKGHQGIVDMIEAAAEPLARFVIRSDEKHGFISNHIATAIAFLLRWHAISGDVKADEKAQILLGRLLAAQSDEGWFPEYDGADPGYQSLCLNYLVDAYLASGETRLKEPIRRAVGFLRHFAHPDGSFGGVYGSRATRLYYPSGLEALRAELPEAAKLADFMRASITRRTTVTLAAIDAPNLAPVFNSYCWAARSFKDAAYQESGDGAPVLDPTPYRQYFPKAGLIVDHGPTHHSVISTRKSVVYHFADGVALRDGGVLLGGEDGATYSSQADDPSAKVTYDTDANTVVIETSLRRVDQILPQPLTFLALRVLTLTLMRIPAVSDLIKRWIARQLVSGKGNPVGSNKRSITLGHALKLVDDWKARIPLQRVKQSGAFSTIHMASQGYWQAQDDAAPLILDSGRQQK